ncbi:uncharacterized protein LOC105280639 [Ooceraea biroi]|nr:uncharacterized protein LOC105280639 [Ooceraea biroi]
MVEFTDSISARIATQMALDNAKIFELHKLADKKKKNQSTRKNTIYKEKLNKIMREDRNNSLSYPSESDLEDSRMRHKKNIQGYPIYHIHTDYPIQVSPSTPDTWLSRRLSSCSISSSENTFMFRRLSSGSSSNSESSRRYSTCSSDSEAGFFHPGSSMEHEESCYITSRRESIDYGSF